MVLDDSMLRRSNALRELMDLARFLISDGEVTQMEAQILQRWIDRHPDMVSVYPIGDLLRILQNAFADGELSEAESKQIQALLEDFAG